MPKVELIRALAIGKLGTPGEYKEALEFVMYNYPNDDVSDKAKAYIKSLEEDNKRQYDMSNKDKPRIVIFADKNTSFYKLKNTIEYKVWQKRLISSVSEFSFDKDVFVIFNFKSWDKAEEFKKEYVSDKLIRSKVDDKNVKSFIISQYNFNILQRKKNIDTYLSKQSSTEKK